MNELTPGFMETNVAARRKRLDTPPCSHLANRKVRKAAMLSNPMLSRKSRERNLRPCGIWMKSIASGLTLPCAKKP
jgi:hypothetical protein